MKSKGFNYLLLLCILLFFNCSILNPTKPISTSNANLIPLKTGNHWDYRTIGYNTDSTDSLIDTVHLNIVSDTILHNENWYLANGIINQYLKNKNDGLYVILKTNPNSIPYLLWKCPALPHETYTVQESYPYSLNIASVDTVITVPAGTFNCYLYVLPNTGEEYFISPGFGIIRNTVFHFDSLGVKHLNGTMELYSYKLIK